MNGERAFGRRRFGIPIAIVVVVATSLAACFSVDSSVDPNTPIVFGPGDLPQASRAQEYTSHDELAADASLIVLVRAEQGRRPNDVPRDEFGFFHAPVEIVEVVSGELAVGDIITIRTEVSLPGKAEIPVLYSGRDFLLYLVPLEFLDGRTTGEWVAVGYLAGYFEKRPDGRLRKIDPESPLIPEFVTKEAVKDASDRASDN